MQPFFANVIAGGRNALSQEHVQAEPWVQEKLHRAALLRNRFADTILKARDKTFPSIKRDRSTGKWDREKTFPSIKGNTIDLEKLKREKEELEKLQREEKARLQAEAKAAENARKKVEAIALENARREREAQRHAARLVLQQMERTVEIDETNDYLKDLELLGRAPVEGLALAGNLSPSHSQDGSTILPFQGGNPLEHLGLFMKEDDEEDEQQMLQPTKLDTFSPPNLNEEGEIDDLT